MIDVTQPAIFNDGPVQTHRIWLRRLLPVSMFGNPRPLISIGYNPSVAGAFTDDPTIRRELALCRLIGASDLIKVNAFTGIATDPDDLAAMADPVGPMADEALQTAADYARRFDGILLACWGVPKGKPATRRLAEARFAQIKAMNLPLHVLRLTAAGYPEHPLYLPSGLLPVPWMNCL